MKTLFLLLLVYSFLPCNAKDKDAFYAVSSIPEGLKKDASAICREYRHEFELKDYGKATERVKMVVTVLDEKGEQFGNLMVFYDKFIKMGAVLILRS